jgi:hypothetical protein
MNTENIVLGRKIRLKIENGQLKMEKRKDGVGENSSVW